MSLQMVFDAFGAAAGDAGNGARVPAGEFFFVFGWAADVTNGAVPRNVTVRVDGSREITARRVQRDDVAIHFANRALLDCGFDAGFSTSGLAPGPHAVTVCVTIGLDVHEMERTFEILAAAPKTSGRRILVAGLPKSGSTFAWRALNEYFGTTSPPLEGLLPPWEPNLDAWVRERLPGGSYVFGMHVRAYDANLRAIREENLTTVVTWRNLGDTIVSIDDHYRSEGGTLGAFFIDNAQYAAMPEQQRYQFLVRHYAPWCIAFYLGWKRAGAPIFRYEAMAADSKAYLASIVNAIDGAVDPSRVEAALAKPLSGTRLNVGKAGRSATKFADDTKRLLEDLLEHHAVPLDDLLAELPWRSAR